MAQWVYLLVNEQWQQPLKVQLRQPPQHVTPSGLPSPFGLQINNCSDQLSVICQTFASYLDGIGLPQHRCADKGACVSHRTLCDGVSKLYCESGDDEWAQNCDKTTGHRNMGTLKKYLWN
ncbi:hypothetical protein niasHT_028851 [Heterodera trifolii]|uniref:Uncharacterized protein n=1 Tax=Heterodera trifolii TaxID=157864 RepID=A0ABD2KQG8_9BILA